MRIVLASTHRYPAGGRTGAGPRANPRTTGGAAHMCDHLVKGLAELGHDVACLLTGGADPPLPDGARWVAAPPRGADVIHQINAQFLFRDWMPADLLALETPWLATCHLDTTAHPSPPPGQVPGALPPNWVLVSERLAGVYGHPRFVRNGVDPAELIFSASKANYFLFCCRADVADKKGFPAALALSRATGVPLTVMACSSSDSVMGRLAARCAAAGVRFVGDVRGGAKAELFAGAKALLLPTEFEEGCPVVIAEALMSGTPVIASPRGGCAEMVTPGVGFLCETADDYLRAAGALASVRPEDCRRRATEAFHYLDMAERYVNEYREEIEFYASSRDAYVEQTLLRFTGRARREPRGGRR